MPGIDYDCAGCGHRHEGADGTVANPWPLIEFTRPEVYLRMDSWEQLTRTRSTDELCLIDNGRSVDCYLTGYLSLPVLEEAAMLVYMPWVQVREKDYLDLVEHWEQPHYRGDYLGTLASELPGCEDSLSVPVRVIAPARRAPLVVPELTSGHALVREEQEGISRQEAELRLRSMLLEDPEH
ncbi:DUF2199 domain-containing protein [uncultured Brachybacterium sp.]|uniref:DUF2199 domain-containing protein n=1 Tax=uncultured Brachybacterium sp. TaxID=189680 RepID=UPI00261479C0|nr:DUF2199 domain-containing protein [uncultured Brachybacterium sp.]